MKRPVPRLPSPYGAFAIPLWGVAHPPMGRFSPLGERKKGAIDNVSGQCLNKMQKGINIREGKEVLVK